MFKFWQRKKKERPAELVFFDSIYRLMGQLPEPTVEQWSRISKEQREIIRTKASEAAFNALYGEGKEEEVNSFVVNGEEGYLARYNHEASLLVQEYLTFRMQQLKLRRARHINRRKPLHIRDGGSGATTCWKSISGGKKNVQQR